MILHGVLLTAQFLLTVVEALVPYIPFFLKWSNIIAIILTSVDVIVQLLICFICVTVGSDVRLRKFKMTLDMTTGVPTVKFCLKDNIAEV